MRIQIKVKIMILKGFINGLWLVGLSKTAFWLINLIAAVFWAIEISFLTVQNEILMLNDKFRCESFSTRGRGRNADAQKVIAIFQRPGANRLVLIETTR
jgi:hypothetical protein